MANTNNPFGFTPIRHKNGAPYNGSATPYIAISTYSADMFIGNAVLIVAGGSNTAQSTGGDKFKAGTLQSVELAATSGFITGVIVGFGVNRDDLSITYGPTDTERIVWVADDPDLVFIGQEDSAASENIQAADVGFNVNLVVGTGSKITGRAASLLDSTSAATTNTHQLKVLRLYDVSDNEISTADTPAQYAVFEFMINLHSQRNPLGV